MGYLPDLDSYFRRIAYSGERSPTLQTLNEIIRAHVQTIPFENLDVLLGRGVSLAPQAVESKLVESGRGGYCFEQNSLLLHMLSGLGFSIEPISARVRLQRERSSIPPRTHMFLRVEIEGEYWLADVGVGVLSPTCALRLVTEESQSTPHESRRLIREGSWFGENRSPDARIFHQALLGDTWEDVCDFTLEAMPEIDREVANWFTSASPQSHFLDRLIVARATAKGRLSLVNDELKVRGADGIATTRQIVSYSELLEVIDEHFGIQLPRDTRFNVEALAGLSG